MSFLRRVAGLSLRDRVRTLDFWRELRVEPLLTYLFLAWERLAVPQEKEERRKKSVAGERDVWNSLLSLLPP